MEFLLNLDRQIFLLINSNSADFVIFLSLIFSGVGIYKIFWLVTGVFVIYLLRSRPQMILALIAAVLVAYFLAYAILKPWFGRERPHGLGVSGKVVFIYDPQSDYFSFPSIHSSMAFAAAVVLAFIYPGVWIYIYSTALLVAISRIILGAHYPSDVAAGAVLGFFVGWIVTRLLSIYSGKKSVKKR